MQSLIIYETGKISTPPVRARGPALKTLVSNRLDAIRHTLNTMAIMTNGTDSITRCPRGISPEICLFFIFLFFKWLPSTLVNIFNHIRHPPDAGLQKVTAAAADIPQACRMALSSVLDGHRRTHLGPEVLHRRTHLGPEVLHRRTHL